METVNQSSTAQCIKRSPALQGHAFYKGVRLVCFPSGMGGVLPAAVAEDDGASELLHVICLHEEYYPNWVLTVKRSELTEFRYQLLTDFARKCINDRLRVAA